MCGGMARQFLGQRRCALATFRHPRSANSSTLIFSEATPDTRFLVGVERELQTGLLDRACLADVLGKRDLFDCHTGRSDGEKQPCVRGATLRFLSPIVNVPGVFAFPSQTHKKPLF